jgi:ABC-type enterochelin transport system permease subunit
VARRVQSDLDSRFGPRRAITLGTGAAAALLASAYAAQIPSPLRLTTDSIAYLQIARSLATGHGIPPHAAFPPGLPALYAALDVVGAGTAPAFVAVNCAFLALALLCALYLYRRSFGLSARTACLLLLLVPLSYVALKHSVLALSDVPFLGLTYAALASMAAAATRRTSRRWVLLVTAAALTAAAIATRTTGIALVPAWIVALVEAARTDLPLLCWVRRRRTAAIGVSICAIAAVTGVSVAVSDSRYFGGATGIYARSSVGGSLQLVVDHFRNWGELAANVPRSRIPRTFDEVLVAVGVAAVALILWGLRRVRKLLDPIPVFTIVYLLLLFAWPYEDARFWLPLLPLAVAYVWIAVQTLVRRRLLLGVLSLYIAAYCVLGVIAIATSTRITYAGTRFPERYGESDGGLEATYRVALGVAEPGDDARVNRAALAILRRYERRARP